jgi:hypothetical protein
MILGFGAGAMKRREFNAPRRRRGRIAARGARAAGCVAGDRVHTCQHARRERAGPGSPKLVRRDEIDQVCILRDLHRHRWTALYCPAGLGRPTAPRGSGLDGPSRNAGSIRGGPKAPATIKLAHCPPRGGLDQARRNQINRIKLFLARGRSANRRRTIMTTAVRLAPRRLHTSAVGRWLYGLRSRLGAAV